MLFKNKDTEGISITDSNEVILKKPRKITLGRPIWEILEMVKVYRQYQNAQKTTANKAVEAVEKYCKAHGISPVSKKSLDDYWNNIQKAYKYGFDFNETCLFNTFGVVKNFVQQHLQLEQQNKNKMQS